jgi:catechol 2,3-dioxygenase-like lactoylglutathione lyase family enzyme
MITAPLSRFLAVADAKRSIAFYRDVLGFEVREASDDYGFAAIAEVVSGAAQIQLGNAESAYDSTGKRRPRGAAILFFETDDVAALHATVVTRGGKPSELEKVNWIKYRLFEIRDPDGHTLWFGQSYHEPRAVGGSDTYADMHTPAGSGQLRQIIPELPLRDIPAGVSHYRHVLGFRVNYANDNLGIMDRDSVTIALVPRSERHQGIGSCYVYIRDADALHAELVAKGARVLDQPTSMPWGLRQFHVLDLEDNQITFGQTFE